MKHFHATIASSDGAAPNSHILLEAESIEQARTAFAAAYGKDAVLRVWDDYFESHAPAP
jgi:hypothetical protein